LLVTAASRHQREALQIVLPELRLAAKAAQLDHRQREIETTGLGLGDDLAVEIKAGHILGAFSEISQPLLPMGRKTPISMSELLCLDRK
jgi:hypothetical protein